jgi:putative peptidoglycan lipid II flippase
MFGAVRTLLVGGVVGKALGIVRELVSAALLGTGPIASAYRLSQAGFLIPLHGFVSDALGAGFTPTYALERGAQRSRRGALFACMNAILLVCSTSIAVIVAILAAPWVRLLAPGFGGTVAGLSTRMIEIMVMAMPLYALSGLCASAELAAGRAELAAARASFQNVGLVVGTLLAWWCAQPTLIAVGFVLAHGWLAAWGLKLAVVDKLPLWPRACDWAEARQSLGQVWRAFSVVVWIPVLMQVHFVIERRVASVVNTNAVAALDYARFVSDTAVLLLAMPFGFAGLAAMTTMTQEQFREAAARSFRFLLYVGVPLSVALGLHAEWAVRILLGRGAFGPESIAATAAILQGIGVGLWAQLIGYAGVKFLNARGQNRTVVRDYVLALTCNIAINLLLQSFLGVSVLGVASATNGLVLGFLVLVRLRLLAPLRNDLLALMSVASGYVIIWLLLPSQLSGLSWLPPILFTVYWCVAVVAISHCRRMTVEVWHLLRPTRSADA